MNENPFSLSGAALYARDGRAHLLTAEEQAPEAIRFSGDAGSIQVDLIREKGLTAYRVAGQLNKAQPVFGYQPALCEHRGLALELTLPNKMPFVSIYQHKEWWMRPAFGTAFAQIPPQSQLVVFEGQDGYAVFLAVCGEENRADLEGWEGGLRLALSSNLANQTALSDLAMVYGQGADPYALIEEAVGLALRLTGKRLQLRREKKFPSIFEKIGWCTWDSLGQSVNERAVFEKMDEFAQKKLPIAWVLIDDGWSAANREKQTLAGLDADLEKFPAGIAGTVRALKERYQVEQVGVWQAIKGYWNGIEEGSAAQQELAPYLTRYPNGEVTMKPEAEAAFGFWNRWHSHLKKAGVDFIKVDSQSSFSLAAQGSCTYGKLAQAVHIGLEASADLHFGGNLINCMGMAPEDIWNRQSAALSRNSDDFTPTVPGSFSEHALQNCYNSIYHGCFYWGDWDMVWSRHEDVKQNMMIRVLSGGPVYLSDGAGNTDPEQVWPVILDDGTILRCQDVARPTLDCLVKGGECGNGLLKIYNRYGDTVYVAAIPVKEQAEALQGSLQASDFPFDPGEAYWIYDWKKKEAELYGRDSAFSFALAPKDAELFHLIPRQQGIAVVGIVDKYISAACVECIAAGEREYLIRSACAGQFGFLTRERVKEVRQDGMAISFEKKGDLYFAACAGKGHVLSIQLEP